MGAFGLLLVIYFEGGQFGRLFIPFFYRAWCWVNRSLFIDLANAVGERWAADDLFVFSFHGVWCYWVVYSNVTIMGVRFYFDGMTTHFFVLVFVPVRSTRWVFYFNVIELFV